MLACPSHRYLLPSSRGLFHVRPELAVRQLLCPVDGETKAAGKSTHSRWGEILGPGARVGFKDSTSLLSCLVNTLTDKSVASANSSPIASVSRVPFPQGCELRCVLLRENSGTLESAVLAWHMPGMVSFHCQLDTVCGVSREESFSERLSVSR